MTMAADARFEETYATPENDKPLKLKAECGDDLSVVSTLVQDAVGKTGEILWQPKKRRLLMVLNRFRWEDAPAAERQGRPYERVRAVLAIADVARVRSRGLDPRQKDVVFSLLAIDFLPGEECDGTLRLALAGDGELAVEVECLNIALLDVSKPWPAASEKAPNHAAD